MPLFSIGELVDAAALLDLAISSQQAEACRTYCGEVYSWNDRINLTRVPPEQALTRHVLESLSVAPLLASARSIVDIGTGAGFPGVPLAAALGACRITLLDCTAKRLRFIDHACAVSGIANVFTVHARAEEYRPPALFDCAVARAVAPMERLAGWMLRHVRPGGTAIAMKSTEQLAEVRAAATAIRDAGGGPAETRLVAIPGADHDLLLVSIPRAAAAAPAIRGTRRRQLP